MAYPFIRRLIKALVDPGIKSDLSHEHKQRDHGEPVIGKYRPELLADHVYTGINVENIGKAAKTHQGHGKAYGHAEHEQQQHQAGDPEDAHQGQAHLESFRINSLTRSINSMAASRKQPNATTKAKG